MAFIIEDGISRRRANSYVSVDFFRDYSTDRGRTTLAALTDDAIEVLLIRATDYVETRWGLRFKGCRKTTYQGLSWPRLEAYNNEGLLFTGIPDQLCRAVVELAQRANGLDRLIADPPAPYPVKDGSGATVSASTGEIHSETKQAEGLRKTTTYAHSGLKSSRTITHTQLSGVSIQEFPQVTQLVADLINGSAGGYGNTVTKN